MSAQSKQLSWALLESARGIGVERGVDLVLHALFVRWLATQSAGQARWHELVTSANDEELVERFNHLDIFREQSSDVYLDAEAYRSTLRSLVEIIDQSIPTTGPVDAQRDEIADTFDETLGHLSRLGKQSGESDTPRDVARLMVALTVRPGDRVLDPACGNGTGLLLAAKAQPDVSVSGFDINSRVARRASMRLIVHGVETGTGFGAWAGDAFTEYAPGDSDVVIAQPPWNVTFAEHQRETIRRLAGVFPDLSQKTLPKGDMPWLLLALDALARDGRAALVLSGSSVQHRYRDIHEHLLRRGAVEAIIALPAGIFRHTSISTGLWLLREPTTHNVSDSVLMIDPQTLAEATARDQVHLGDEGVQAIANIVADYRSTGAVSAPSHIARAVVVTELHLD
ncbi:HsdM family class I SAM-dependent methyltransferase [Nocardioides kribbensis]|uniref:N-6 DNA methylase n=1 Tax=Nocardioides kribbensis TaxID=305517 RepID=A0ABV1P2J0_9ACTN